jgi:WD40 repeat protein
MPRRSKLSVFVLLVATAAPAQELKERAVIKGLKFRLDHAMLSRDGKLLALGGGDSRGGDLRLWDATTGKELGTLSGFSNSLYALAFSPDGKCLATGGTDLVQVWAVEAHRELARFNFPGSQFLAFGPDGTTLAAGGSRQVKRWDLTSGKELVSFQHRIAIYGRLGLAFSPDLTTLAARDYQEIDLWELATGKHGATLSEHRGEVGCLAYSADGKTLIATSTRYYDRYYKWQGDVKLWDVATHRERARFEERIGRVTAVALSPDGKTLALLDSPAIDFEAYVKLVDIPTSRQRALSAAPRTSYFSLQFTDDGKLFVIGKSSDSLKLWEVLSPRLEAK